MLDINGAIEDPYRNFIAISRYARWLPEENRRETWKETVDRYVQGMVDHLELNMGYVPPTEDVEKVRDFIMNHMALPSMRALMTAGPALARNNIAGYNCSYVVVDNTRAFDEILYILMNGTGVGFSAETRYTEQLPTVPATLHNVNAVIVVADSKEGWADAYRKLIDHLYMGEIPSWNTEFVRPAGARLKTFGGRASGPEPLEDLFRFTIDKFQQATGRKLTDLEVHDLVCKIASVVVVGGVRRSALISLGDIDSEGHRHAKDGAWWENNAQRALANNSAVYDEKPTREVFDREWKALIASGSGERGIFNRDASRRQAAKNGRRDANIDFGTNPCSEIILRPYQFCNLTSVVVRETDTIEDLEEKVRVATILGTWQSTLTNFRYIRDIWKENTEAERLLGVSMTGPFGNDLLNGRISMNKTANVLSHLREVAIATNMIEAEKIGINPSAAITCVKPEGTASQLTGTSSGLHAWHSEYYIRTVRGDKKDAVSQFLQDSGLYWEDDAMNPSATSVFYFPIKAPRNALTRNDLTAIEHLELWLVYQRNWCEHKPSVTIYVRDNEWAEVGNWVYKHFDEISGISFLPHSEHTYVQAPYQDLTEDEYIDWMLKTPKNINWELLSVYETSDQTTGTQELSCVAGSCEVVDIGSANVDEEVEVVA